MDIDFSIQTRLFLGLYEVELNGYIRRLCPPDGLCFDIGAQFGYDALVLAKLSRGQVTTFESDPAMVAQLQRNVSMNPEMAGRIDVVHAFVGRDDDPATDHVTLDGYVSRAGGIVPEFIKMDIEGGEVDALQGARGILASQRTSLLIETHSARLESECQDLLNAYGYTTGIVNQRRWVQDYRPAEHNRWLVGPRPSRD